MRLFKRGSASSLSPFRTLTIPAGVVWIVCAYVVVDIGMHMFHEEHNEGHSQVVKSLHGSIARGWPALSGNDASCDSVAAHMDQVGSVKFTVDPWKQLKWGLPPAFCRVNGHLIERLDPQNNFRRGVALRFTDDLDDKTHIEQWFLGAKVDLNLRKRRVLIDLGANYFSTSLTWFLTRYPCDFTEVYAFETDPSLLQLPEGFDEKSNWVPAVDPGYHKIKSREGGIPSWMVKRIKTYTKFAGDVDDEQSINVTRFIKDELKLTAHDTVIVKMDIEGAEWPILQRWAADPAMAAIIDELFVEVHYYHPDNGWESVKQWTRDDATRILAELRHMGLYAHYWD